MHIPVFLIEVALALTIGLVALLFLRRVMQSVLTDLCGTAQRAAFWSRFSQLFLLVCPLLGTLLLASDQEATAAFSTTALRETLRHVLSSTFVTLLVIGVVIWSSIDQPEKRPPLGKR